MIDDADANRCDVGADWVRKDRVIVEVKLEPVKLKLCRVGISLEVKFFKIDAMVVYDDQ